MEKKTDRAASASRKSSTATPGIQSDILDRQVEIQQERVGYFALYRYASRSDVAIIVVSVLSAIVAGGIFPLMSIPLGKLISAFTQFSVDDSTRQQLDHDLDHYTLFFIYFGIGEFFSFYICTAGFIYVGESITKKIRSAYLKAVLRQNMAIFDSLGTGEVITRITSDTNIVQNAISEKVSLVITAVATFGAAFIVAFVYSWKITSISLAAIVAILLALSATSPFAVRFKTRALEAGGYAASVAQEVLASVKNVVAHGLEDRLVERFDTHLQGAETFGIRSRTAMSFGVGLVLCFFTFNIGLDLWEGSRLLVRDEVSLSSIVSLTFSIMFGVITFGTLGAHVESFSAGAAAGAKIYAIIDRKIPIDALEERGEQPDDVQGCIEFKDVTHVYPLRREVLALQNFSLTVPAGKVTAIVGESGSGKSSLLGLLERFYEPVSGTVLLDGRDITTLNINWLRRNMSLVNQEPILFTGSVYENIRCGLGNITLEAEEELAAVEEAAKLANAHEFIIGLSDGYDTDVGERGSRLSGGQKQRVSIARALVSQPKILLLDEATSNLDSQSEKVVQDALEAASRGRTTIVVSHRLSTVSSADNIVVMSAGGIVEQGTHEELLSQKGRYSTLMKMQQLADLEKQPQDEISADVVGVSRNEKDMGASEETIVEKEEAELPIVRQVDDTEAMKASKYTVWSIFKFVAGLNSQEVGWMLCGIVCAVISGGGQTTAIFFFGESVRSLSQDDPSDIRSDSNFWASMFLMLGLVQLAATWGHGICFAICSERLQRRVQTRALRTMLRQDVSFFDADSNSSSSLASFISVQTGAIAGMSGSVLGTLLSGFTTLVSAIALAIIFCWKLGLVCLATLPVLLASAFWRVQSLARLEDRSRAAHEASASYAGEAVSAIRTVAALTREVEIVQEYERLLNAQVAKSLPSTFRITTIYAASRTMFLLCAALYFYYGGKLIARREFSTFEFFVCFTEVSFGTQMSGIIFSHGADIGRAYAAARKVKGLFMMEPQIGIRPGEGEVVPSSPQPGVAAGGIEFVNVSFAYPTRPDKTVLRNLNLRIEPGQYVGVVGASGRGKSTIIGLIERFYDPYKGAVMLDGTDIRRLSLTSHRAQIALVMQETTLYQATIKENILLGLPSDRADSEVTQAELEQACKDANILDFILSLPGGFDTTVGQRGYALSGGQKQRIAIARALLRNPRILILDEATSALDSESEHLFQEGLNRVVGTRTTIAVAHRLSTIQNADIIFVLEDGAVAEQGTHEQLWTARGRYYELAKMQGGGAC